MGMILYKISLSAKIAKLQELIKKIRILQGRVDLKQFLTDDVVRSAVERYLQLALEAVLDIADQVIGEQDFRKPEDYKDNILILAENKVIPQAFAKRFALAAGFRNILVHDYLKLDYEKVYQHFKEDTRDLEQFLKYIARYLKEN